MKHKCYVVSCSFHLACHPNQRLLLRFWLPHQDGRYRSIRDEFSLLFWMLIYVYKHYTDLVWWNQCWAEAIDSGYPNSWSPPTYLSLAVTSFVWVRTKNLWCCLRNFLIKEIGLNSSAYIKCTMGKMSQLLITIISKQQTITRSSIQYPS